MNFAEKTQIYLEIWHNENMRGTPYYKEYAPAMDDECKAILKQVQDEIGRL
jgi:hypothetical protein